MTFVESSRAAIAQVRVSISIAMILLTTFLGCQERASAPKPPIPVKVWTVEISDSDSGTRYSATIKPNIQVEAAFKLGGYVSHILQIRGEDGRLRTVQEGDRVKKGSMLARLRESDYVVKRNQVRALLVEGEAAESQVHSFLSEAEASFQQAKAEFERAKNLLQVQSALQADFDAAKARYEIAQAAIEKAKAQLQMARARVEGLREQVQEADLSVQDSILTAPMDGIIIKRFVEVGSLMTSGRVAFVIADTTTVKAAFGVSDIVIPSFAVGSKFSLTAEAFRGNQIPGRVSRIAPSADPSSRVFEVELTIPNPKDQLMIGMIVSLNLVPSKSSQGLPAVPLSSIVRSVRDPKSYAVYVVENTGDTARARLREISLGNPLGNRILVLGGLKANDNVVVVGANMVTDGEEIQIIP